MGGFFENRNAGVALDRGRHRLWTETNRTKKAKVSSSVLIGFLLRARPTRAYQQAGTLLPSELLRLAAYRYASE